MKKIQKNIYLFALSVCFKSFLANQKDKNQNTKNSMLSL